MKNIKLSEDKFAGWGIETDGSISSFVTSIDNLLKSESDQETLDLLNQLRRYKRSQAVMEEVSFVILDLKEYHSERDGYPKHSFKYEGKALFAYASMLYRSCFVQGEKGKRPLEEIEKEFKNREIHITLRDIVDKGLAHLDKNGHIRSLNLSWDYKLSEDGLFHPIRSNASGSLLGNYHITFVEGWLNLVYEIIDRIKEEIRNFEEELNKKLPKVKIEKKSV